MKQNDDSQGEMTTVIILADYASEAEYHAIKDPHGDPFPTLEQHRAALA